MCLERLRHRLLVQCPLDRADTVAPITARYHSGLVLTGSKPRTTVRHLHRLDYPGPILCDAGRYTGRDQSAYTTAAAAARINKGDESSPAVRAGAGKSAAGASTAHVSNRSPRHGGECPVVGDQWSVIGDQ